MDRDLEMGNRRVGLLNRISDCGAGVGKSAGTRTPASDPSTASRSGVPSPLARLLTTLRKGCLFHHRQSACMQRTLEMRRQPAAFRPQNVNLDLQT